MAVTTTKKAEDVSNLKLEVALLKRDGELFDRYFTKIDSTIENIERLTSKMSTIIELHDARLVSQGQENDLLKKEFADHKTSTTAGFEKLEKQIENVKTSLQTSIEEERKTLQAGMKEERTKVNKLTFWKYYMIGAVSVLTFVGGIILTIFSNQLIHKFTSP